MKCPSFSLGLIVATMFSLPAFSAQAVERENEESDKIMRDKMM